MGGFGASVVAGITVYGHPTRFLVHGDPLAGDDPLLLGQNVAFPVGHYAYGAGNISTRTSDTIILNLLAPDTTITSGPVGASTDTAAFFTFGADQPGAVFSVKVDSGEWSEWSASTEYLVTALTAGNHYIKVKAARDLDGDGVEPDEEDPTPAEWTWTVVGDLLLPPPIPQPFKYWRID